MDEAELEDMHTRSERAFNSTDRALAEIEDIARRAKELLPQLRRMRRRLNRDTKRLCDALNAIKIV